MSAFEVSSRNRVRRVSERASYERHAIDAILDAAPLCHVAFEHDGQPFIIPLIHARVGDALLLHGSKASRLIQHVGAGHPVCVAVTLLDGLVLARSIFHHSMNYRSAIVFGRGEAITDEQRKLRFLEALSEKLIPGRWADARPPSQKELEATAVVRIAIESGSAKVRTGPPVDEEQDYALPVWAGVLPYRQGFDGPVHDPRLVEGVDLPEYLVRISNLS